MFYDPDGLKTVARLLDIAIDIRRDYSQNRLAELAGIAPNTIKNIRANRAAFQYKPDPDTLMALASHLIDPRSDKVFDPEDLLDIARGKQVIEDLDPTPPDPPAVAFLKGELVRWPNVAAFAADCGLRVSAVEAILAGRLPTWAEVLRLSTVLYADKNPAPLLKLYGVDEDAPIA